MTVLFYRTSIYTHIYIEGERAWYSSSVQWSCIWQEVSRLVGYIYLPWCIFEMYLPIYITGGNKLLAKVIKMFILFFLCIPLGFGHCWCNSMSLCTVMVKQALIIVWHLFFLWFMIMETSCPNTLVPSLLICNDYIMQWPNFHYNMGSVRRKSFFFFPFFYVKGVTWLMMFYQVWIWIN